MKVILREQKDILEVQNELMNILPELSKRPFCCEIKRYYEKRSLDANAYFHVLVDKIAKVLKRSPEDIKVEMNLEYGTFARDEETGQLQGFMALKNIPVSKFCKYAKPIREVEENGKVFVQYLVRKHTSELDNKEMADLIDGVIEEAKNLDIETLTPVELAALEGYKKEN